MDVTSQPAAAPRFDASLADFRDRVRHRVATRRARLEAISGDHLLNAGEEESLRSRASRDAAVLIHVREHASGPHVLLTRRADHLSTHQGQIAFPGGKIESGETPEQAAVREACEEVGLKEHNVEILGRLGPYYSGSGFRITPIISLEKAPQPLVADAGEVAEIFDVPLKFLMDTDNARVESRIWQEKERFFYAMYYQDGRDSPPVERRIWGITAGIIHVVRERLYGE